MNKLKINYYKSTLLQIKRGNNRGVFSNAKPIFLISIFDSIKQGIINNNQVYFSDDGITLIYNNNYQLYSNLENITPIYMPFFHLSSEEYWHIRWKDGNQPKTFAHTPSSKYLRENIEYAYLDNALWDLLQDDNSRSIFRETIVNHFLRIDNKSSKYGYKIF